MHLAAILFKLRTDILTPMFSILDSSLLEVESKTSAADPNYLLFTHLGFDLAHDPHL